MSVGSESALGVKNILLGVTEILLPVYKEAAMIQEAPPVMTSAASMVMIQVHIQHIQLQHSQLNMRCSYSTDA